MKKELWAVLVSAADDFAFRRVQPLLAKLHEYNMSLIIDDYFEKHDRSVL